jgi:phosphate transport system substrate-binding protein
MLTDLLDFATSTDADNVVRKAGFIDLGVEVRGQGLDTGRAAALQSGAPNSYEAQFETKMLEEMVNYDRLSTTFRFRTGSSRLDERGQLDLKRLADFMQSQPDTAELVMVGFTDSVGAFDANMRLSVDRASAVIGQLQSEFPDLAKRVSIQAGGYGEVSPVACNASDSGRSINRRVEVWLKSNTGVAG